MQILAACRKLGSVGFGGIKLGGGAGERSFRHDSTYHGLGAQELNREVTGFHTDRRLFAGLSLLGGTDG